jgi:hypothetical protein
VQHQYRKMKRTSNQRTKTHRGRARCKEKLTKE